MSLAMLLRLINCHFIIISLLLFDINSAINYHKAIAKVHSGLLSESQSVPGGCQLVG